MKNLLTLAVCLVAIAGIACQPGSTEPTPATAETPVPTDDGAAVLIEKYTTVALTADLSALTDNQRQMLALLVDAAQPINEAYWLQTYGDKNEILGSVDGDLRRFVEWNFGPWDRLDGNAPFVDGAGDKPDGAAFYPQDATKEEIEEAAKSNAELLGLYTMVHRAADGTLETTPYSVAFGEHYQVAAAKLREAAELAEDPGLKSYLGLRADALLSDDYQPSDLAWMDMKSNAIDIVIGPIETYEDHLFGAKASNEAFVLVKDRAWSDRLQRYASFLPELQAGLPVPDEYKKEMPGANSDLGAYDVVYVAGDANAGSKTIAINLPNDEEVQLQKGTRRLQLKNAMRAKFDKILVPIAGVLIADGQRANVKFDAFFANTMFHEVAHGLGIKTTLDGGGTVRDALKDHSSVIEEGKADVLGLYMVTSLQKKGELSGDVTIDDYYTTFMASIFRSIRFGSSSAHGVTNLIRFNYFAEHDAFTRDDATGTYSVDTVKLATAMASLSEAILRLQGDGDYDAAAAFIEKYGQEPAQLRADLERLTAAGIPVDIVYEQGKAVLGL